MPIQPTTHHNIEVSETGGARIGMGNATWPFAKLKVTRNRLELNATILGSLIFRPSDIISIEPYSEIVKSGIRINHSVSSYNDKVIFWNSGDSAKLISKIKQTGFLDNKDTEPFYITDEITALQTSGGFPIKIPAAIAIVVIWNLLCLPSFLPFFTHPDKANSPAGSLGMRLALGFIFCLCALLLVAEPVQKLILKPGRDVKSIKPFLYFLMFISGMMILMNFLLPQLTK